MTYGSPASIADVPRYLAAVRGGREPSDELVAEFRRRYTLIGGSPLVQITQDQAAAVEAQPGRSRDGARCDALLRAVDRRWPARDGRRGRGGRERHRHVAPVLAAADGRL